MQTWHLTAFALLLFLFVSTAFFSLMQASKKDEAVYQSRLGLRIMQERAHSWGVISQALTSLLYISSSQYIVPINCNSAHSFSRFQVSKNPSVPICQIFQRPRISRSLSCRTHQASKKTKAPLLQTPKAMSKFPIDQTLH